MFYNGFYLDNGFILGFEYQRIFSGVVCFGQNYRRFKEVRVLNGSFQGLVMVGYVGLWINNQIIDNNLIYQVYI